LLAIFINDGNCVGVGIANVEPTEAAVYTERLWMFLYRER